MVVIKNLRNGDFQVLKSRKVCHAFPSFIAGAMLASVVALAGCSSGTPSGDTSGADPTIGCTGDCGLDGNIRLETEDVEQVLAQAINEAQAQGVEATVAVVDRVGNVLGVYRMGDRRDRVVTISSGFTDLDGDLSTRTDQIYDVRGGLEGITLPVPGGQPGSALDINLDHQAAISKAITGAYLSTEGMAFTSRTANQIVQEHFNPGEDFQPAGPLFGVQFSQLGCGDFISDRSPAEVIAGITPGPHAAPLGLSADAGGLPLYKNGALVGGVGVLADGVYGLDKFIADVDRDVDEMIAIAGTFGFGAPVERRDRITVEGKVFRYSDADFNDLTVDPANAAPFSSIGEEVGSLIAVRNFHDGSIRAGTVFGTPESGIAPDTAAEFNTTLDAFVFVDESGENRYPPAAGQDAGRLDGVDPLSTEEVRSVLSNALATANRARAQIRRPLNTPARVTISVVDSMGNILGMVRGRDAPTFGADVSLQKARTAAFFSSDDAADYFLNPTLGPERPGEETFDPTVDNVIPPAVYVQPGDIPGLPNLNMRINLESYVTQLRDFLGSPTALADGAFAFSDRAGGNMSRPFYPDGIDSETVGMTGHGPLSKPYGFNCSGGVGVDFEGTSAASCEWSVFSTGLQLDLVYNAAINGVVNTGAPSPDGVSPVNLTAIPQFVPEGAFCAGRTPLQFLGRPYSREVVGSRLANGLQIFPGSVPIYRGETLVGAIGISGDGVDQDDMIAFLGVHLAGEQTGTINNAPFEMRADQLTPDDVRLRYIQCPQNPFIGSNEENVCDGL